MTSLLLRAVATVLLWAVLSVGLPGQAANAGEAGLVVEYGDGTTTYVLVVFPEAEISSLELLRRSGLSLTTVSSGGLGEAICSIEREGCSLADCSSNLCQTGDPDSPFWKFFRVGSGGSWVMQPLGASATRVQDGQLDLWSWTGGDSALAEFDLQRVIERTVAPADRTDGDVFIAWFDADGNPINPPSTDSTGDDSLITGLLFLALIGGIGFLMIRRQRRLFGPLESGG
jgi:hypothetical protein